MVNEVVHEAKPKKLPCFVFKADFKKAYNSIRWDFLAYKHFRLGFGAKWIKWIWRCLHSSSISVLVNGSPMEEFCMKK